MKRIFLYRDDINKLKFIMLLYVVEQSGSVDSVT